MRTSSIDSQLQQAALYRQAGQWEQATQILQQVVAQRPDHALAHAQLGELALMRRDAPTAEKHLTIALTADPRQIATANNLAILYWTSGRAEQAVTVLLKSLPFAPDFAPAHFNLGSAYLTLHDYDKAIASLETAVRLRPDYATALNNLARAYRLTFQPERFWETLREAAKHDVKPTALSNVLFNALFSPTLTAAEVAELGNEWETRFAKPLRPNRPPNVRRNRERPLHIGYIGPNFRRHSNGYLIEPVLERHDRTQFHVFCYSDVTKPDDLTTRLQALDLTYRETANLSDDALARQIRDDKIDILVDLNAHMAGCRLGVFARRAAPIQVNYLAYPFTCGIQAMDYRVSCPLLDPPGGPQYGPEAVIRLSHGFWLYRPNPEVPEPATELPARSVGSLTFANFNDTRKLNTACVSVWAKILQRVPNARFRVLSEDPANQRPYLERLFASVGADVTQVEQVGPLPHREHMTRYRDIDLCLDPFPYGGHTSTLDSLWMGVPVLTLAGSAPYTRGATAILNRVGLPELVAGSPDEYITTAVRLAQEPEQLTMLRAGLRERMRQSPVCEEVGFVTEYEAALRVAWNRYCDNLPPANF